MAGTAGRKERSMSIRWKKRRRKVPREGGMMDLLLWHGVLDDVVVDDDDVCHLGGGSPEGTSGHFHLSLRL